MNSVTVKNAGREFVVSVRDEADASVLAEIFKVHEYRSIDAIIRNAMHPILDIGAHAGFFSLYIRSLNPVVKIIAVEPEEKNCTQFKKHCVDNNIENVELIKGAVTGSGGERNLYLAKDSHNHSLVTETDEIKTVKTFSLQQILKKCILSNVSLVKVDIEGGEYDFFEGITDADFEKVDAFFIEYHTVPGNTFKTLEQTLREHRFGVQHFPSKFDSSMGFIFAHRKNT